MYKSFHLPFVQDEQGTLLESDLADTSAPVESFLPAIAGDSAGDASNAKKGEVELGNTAGVLTFKTLNHILVRFRNFIDSCIRLPVKKCSWDFGVTFFLRMTFPSVTATMSPLAVLPQFVEVLGRKIDKISSEVDWGSKRNPNTCTYTRKNEPDLTDSIIYNSPLVSHFFL